MDKLQWFKFSYADWRMGKIQRCPEVTQLRFLNLCCVYWGKECVLSYEDAEIEIDKEHIDLLIKKKIVLITDGFINISFLDEQFAEIEEKSKDKRISGIIGNLKRWHPKIYKRYDNKEINLEEAINLSQSIADLSHTDCTPIAEQSQNIAEKIREEEIREEKRIKEIEEMATPKKFSFFNSLVSYGFNKDLVNDWLKVRKTKKATNTETALNSFLSEVEKSNLNKDEILKICIERDWKGFKVEWLKNVETKQDIKSEYSFLDQYKKK